MVTSYPIQFVLQKPDLNRRTTTWATKLRGYDITYVLRIAMKSQIMADFIAEFVVSKQQEHEEQTPTEVWSLYIDGSSNEKGSITTNPKKEKLRI